MEDLEIEIPRHSRNSRSNGELVISTEVFDFAPEDPDQFLPSKVNESVRQVTLNVVEEELTEMEDSESVLDLEDVGKIFGLGGNLLSEPSQRASEGSGNQIEERWSLEIEQIRQLECASQKKQILE